MHRRRTLVLCAEWGRVTVVATALRCDETGSIGAVVTRVDAGARNGEAQWV